MTKTSAILFFLFAFGTGCMAKTAPNGAGAGLSPFLSPDAGGMAGPSGVSAPAAGPSTGDAPSGDGGGDAAGKQEASPDPTSGNETPMTVVGSPLGGSRKPKPCPADFRLCFHDVTVTPRPGSSADGHVTYDLAGVLATQSGPGGTIEGLWHVFVYLIDLAFPEIDHTTSTARPAGDFVAVVTSPPGRVLRLQHEFCKHVTSLDVTLPEETEGPLSIDPCGGSEPTDAVIPSAPRGPRGMPIDAVPAYEFRSQ